MKSAHETFGQTRTSRSSHVVLCCSLLLQLQHLASVLPCGCVPAGLFISGFLAPVPALLVLSSIKLHQLSARSELS